MLDIIKEGIKLNQSLALLPLKAIRRLVDDKNTSAKQMVDVAEDFVSVPFVAASRALDSSCRSCSDKESKACPTRQGGPGAKNIWVQPEVTVFSDVETKTGERRVILHVTGLLCGGWVKRVKQTLEGFEHVESVEFISEKEQFEVTYKGEIPMGEKFRESVREIIIFPEMRKFLGGLGSKLNNSKEVEP